ncbi:FolM Alternative dihydrofolate reductase 1 [hydrothermal vent metagenome]|uniref:FolM Alternative dihydrofolate reductase 1 n=1 Tax=hydrothermal vent metagenome TaxID=652676 RepID=A0A3B0TU82_9ZZZZ
MSKKNKNVLITGAGTRIGSFIATSMADAGYSVVIHYKNSAEDAVKLATKITESGANASPLCADLSSKPQRQGLIKEAAKPFGPLDVLINNASVFEPDSALSLTEELWDEHFELHAKAPIFLARDFARQLPKGTKGNIINIIDERVLRFSPDFFSYNLSKSVLWTATRTLAQSLAPNIRVNAIGPGPTLPNARQSESQFAQSVNSLPLETSASPADIAMAVQFLLSSPSMTGQMLTLDGGEHLEWRRHGEISQSLP